MNFRYLLSKLVPMPMRSDYIVLGLSDEACDCEACGIREHATWWQWRGHIFRHRRQSA